MKNDGAHGVLLWVIGGYIGWMGWKMLENTRAGLSTMSMPLTIVLMALMMLAGLAVIVYGVLLFLRGWRKQNEDSTDLSVSDDDETP